MKTSVKILLLSVVLAGCGSVQTINGVRIPKEKPNYKNYMFVGVTSFAFGYYLSNNILTKKRN